jgi:hypothetical protein
MESSQTLIELSFVKQEQYGNENISSVIKDGKGNSARTYQKGNENGATIRQQDGIDIALSHQTGNGNRTLITQLIVSNTV